MSNVQINDIVRFIIGRGKGRREGIGQIVGIDQKQPVALIQRLHADIPQVLSMGMGGRLAVHYVSLHDICSIICRPVTRPCPREK